MTKACERLGLAIALDARQLAQGSLLAGAGRCRSSHRAAESLQRTRLGDQEWAQGKASNTQWREGSGGQPEMPDRVKEPQPHRRERPRRA